MKLLLMITENVLQLVAQVVSKLLVIDIIAIDATLVKNQDTQMRIRDIACKENQRFGAKRIVSQCGITKSHYVSNAQQECIDHGIVNHVFQFQKFAIIQINILEMKPTATNVEFAQKDKSQLKTYWDVNQT
jgi:hypothetical protein